MTLLLIHRYRPCGKESTRKHLAPPLLRSTLVLTTHNMEEAESLCERIAIMDHGKLVAEDTPQNLILKHAPEPPQAPLHGNIEDVFLALTGHGLRD
jgi:ABC-type sulfate/molybdate transport systems ATPase subunit